jgi:hypothetical protein
MYRPSNARADWAELLVATLEIYDTRCLMNHEIAIFDQKNKISNNHQPLQVIQKVATNTTTTLTRV